VTFLNILLLGGISAAAIPLIMHLFNRRKFDQVKWGAMHLLESVVLQNRRRLKLEQLILLLLRASIPAFLAFCMARPVLTGMKSLARNAKTSMVVMLDNSMSMEAGDAVRSNFAEAREAAATLVDNLPRGSEVAVVGMAGAIPLLEEPSFDRGRTAKALTMCDGGFGKADAAATLEKASGLFSARMHHADREAVIVSDFQRVSWNVRDAGARSRALELLDAHPIPPRLVLFRVGEEVENNISVASVNLSKSVVGINQEVSIRATLANHGRVAYRDLRVYFRVDGKERCISQISIEPDSRAQALFTHEFTSSGSHIVEVHADADRLTVDNTCYMSLAALDRLPVLIVSGDVAEEPLAGESAFLQVALSPYLTTGEDGDLIVTKTVTEKALKQADLAGVSVVILANVSQLDNRQRDDLEKYVEHGGGLLIFPGDRVNVSWYDSKLFLDGQGILPGKFVSLAGSLKEEVPHAAVVAGHYAHTALQPFNDPRSGGLMGAQIRLWYRLQTAPMHDDGAAGARIMARLDGGDPFLIEKEHGAGRVILCCTACDADWNNLPMRPFYLPLMQQLVSFLASKIYPPRNVQVGEEIAAFLALEEVGRKVTLTDPGGEKHEIVVKNSGIHGVAAFEDTRKPGPYLMDVPGQDAIHFVAAVPGEESDVRTLDDVEFRRLGEEMGATTVESWEEYREMSRSRRFGREIWKPLLALVLLLMFCELFAVQLFTRRRL